MKLWALSDLHVGYRENRRLIEELPGAPGDWLVLAGDLCETLADLDFVLGTLGPRFGQLVWVPGNHELWTTSDPARGVAKYERCVALCRAHGVLTPEDEYQVFPGADGASGHLVVWQPGSDTMWELWQAALAPDGWHARWGGRMDRVSARDFGVGLSVGVATSSASPSQSKDSGTRYGAPSAEALATQTSMSEASRCSVSRRR